MHTHLVIANRIQGPDGRWTALDGRDLYRHRLAADAIYRACYQRTLSRTLGVEWTAADSHGNRELQGMPEDLVRGFSKRTGQIDTELDRLGTDGGERQASAGHDDDLGPLGVRRRMSARVYSRAAMMPEPVVSMGVIGLQARPLRHGRIGHGNLHCGGAFL